MSGLLPFKSALILSALLALPCLVLAGPTATAWVEIGEPYVEVAPNPMNPGDTITLLHIPLRGTLGFYYRIEYTDDPFSDTWQINTISGQLDNTPFLAFLRIDILDTTKPLYVRAIVTETDETNPGLGLLQD